MTCTGYGNVSSFTSSRPPWSREGVDHLVGQRPDELVLPALQCLLPGRRPRATLRWRLCSGSSISRMVWPITGPIISTYTVDEIRGVVAQGTWLQSS